MNNDKTNNQKNIVYQLYLKLNTIRYISMFLCFFLIVGSGIAVSYFHVPFGIAISCFIIGMVGAPFALLVPQNYWRCPYCGEQLKTKRRGILVKPDKNCPHCGAEFR